MIQTLLVRLRVRPAVGASAGKLGLGPFLSGEKRRCRSSWSSVFHTLVPLCVPPPALPAWLSAVDSKCRTVGATACCVYSTNMSRTASEEHIYHPCCPALLLPVCLDPARFLSLSHVPVASPCPTDAGPIRQPSLRAKRSLSTPCWTLKTAPGTPALPRRAILPTEHPQQATPSCSLRSPP